MQFAYSKTLRTLAAAAAGMAMLGAVVVTPQVAQAAGTTCNATPYGLDGDNSNIWEGGDQYEKSPFYKCINDPNVSTINVQGLTMIGRTNTSADSVNVTVDRDLTLNGVDGNGRKGILRFFSFNVTAGHTLTLTGDLTIDDILINNSPNVSQIPVTLQAGARLVTRDNVKLITDNGQSEEINSKSLGFAVRVSGNDAVVELGGAGQYNAQANGAQTGSMYPTVYGPDGAVIVDDGVTGAKVTITNGQVLQENGRRAAVQNGGTNSVTTIGGNANVESVSQNGGTFVMNGGNVDRSLFYSYEDIAAGDFAAHNKNSLTLSGGAKGYITKGQIWDYNASEHQQDAPTAKSVKLSEDSALYIQATNRDDVRIDSTNPWIGQLKGDANADNVYSSPSFGANYTPVSGFTSKSTISVNYDLTGKDDLTKLAASDSTAKQALNVTANDQSQYLLSTYAGYHGNYLAYGKYVLNNADQQSTLIDGTGLALVYGVPAQFDYEWYSAAEVKAKKQAGTYPDASSPDQSFVAAGYTGRKFAGWFKSGNEWKIGQNTDNIDVVNNDANYTTTQSRNTTADGTVGQTKFAWAHFADAKNLSVALQTTSFSDKKALRFISTLDSQKYDSVSFNVTFTYKGKARTITLPSTKVYNQIKAGSTLYKPSDLSNTFGTFNGGALSNGTDGYFVTSLLRNVPDDFITTDKSQTITVTPSWKTLDGTVVTGTTVTKNI